jgi:phosphatidylserine decarboxylase
MSEEKNPTLLDTILSTIPPMHKEGWKFVAIFAFVSFILAQFSGTLGWIGFILTLWCAYFFRDPVRVTPSREGLMVSPADGKISMIVKAVPPAELEMGDAPLTRVSIFLNVFDVHVNRVPIAGTITKLHYVPGKFLNAALDKASVDNERQLVKLKMADGRFIAFVQIAGFVARRILCTLKDEQIVVTGERFGLIRFGSRTDVYLPDGVEPLVMVGQYAIGGETVVADLKASEPARTGSIV